MSRYIASCIDGFQTLNCINPEDYSLIRNSLQKQCVSDLHDLSLEIRPGDNGMKQQYSMSPWLGPHVLFLRNGVSPEIFYVLRNGGEFLECLLNGGEVLHMLFASTIDALCKEKSQIRYFENSSKILKINEYHFIDSAIENVDVFRLPLKSSPIFYSEYAVEVLSGISSLSFKRVG